MKGKSGRKELLLWAMVSVSLGLMAYATVRNELAARRARRLPAEIASGTALGGLAVSDLQDISQHQLAGRLGLHRESLSKPLGQMRRELIVQWGVAGVPGG